LIITPVLPTETPEAEVVNSNIPRLIDNNSIDVVKVDIPNRYELPPRSTRRIPQRRYDPEFEAMVFNIAIYSDDVAKNVEEPL
jgi:hypothetical protein